MIPLMAYFLAVVVLGILVWQRGHEVHTWETRAGRTWLIAGLVLVGLHAVFHLVFAIGEMAGGDMSGAGHLGPVIAMVLLGWFAWRRPLEGGIVILALGLVVAAYFGLIGLIVTWTLPAAGVLLIMGTIQARKETTHGASHGR
ncbi:MAG: hypothetical protein IPM53_14770 [Anaerolineaceae bacterium]|nr:hypothetical protein [Anaerolineaceae bacterium]